MSDTNNTEEDNLVVITTFDEGDPVVETKLREFLVNDAVEKRYNRDVTISFTAGGRYPEVPIVRITGSTVQIDLEQWGPGGRIQGAHLMPGYMRLGRGTHVVNPGTYQFKLWGTIDGISGSGISATLHYTGGRPQYD